MQPKFIKGEDLLKVLYMILASTIFGIITCIGKSQTKEALKRTIENVDNMNVDDPTSMGGN